jgi:flagellar biogenesis protein FliO
MSRPTQQDPTTRLGTAAEIAAGAFALQTLVRTILLLAFVGFVIWAFLHPADVVRYLFWASQQMIHTASTLFFQSTHGHT